MCHTCFSFKQFLFFNNFSPNKKNLSCGFCFLQITVIRDFSSSVRRVQILIMIFTYQEYHNYFIYWQKTLTVKLNRTHEFIEKLELDWKLNEASWIMQYSLKICFSSTHARNKIKQINFEFMVFGLAGVNHFPTRVLVNLQKKYPNALNFLTRIFLNLPLCSFLLKFQFAHNWN